MDISEILSLAKFFVPAIAACVIFLVAMRVRPQWLRLSIKFFATTLFGCGALLVFGLLVVQASCTRRPPPLYSPDQRHLAIISYALQGALGDDYATVRVRRRWIPWATVAYNGPSGWDFKNNKPGDPEVRWLDSVHLLIRYYDYRNGRGGSVCRSQIGAVRIICDRITSAGAQ